MGLCKLKWTAEEELAIRNGIIKHGAGKWREILRDAEFSSVLRARSNVDLKDKWRNMQFAENGVSRSSCRTLQKNFKKTSRHCDESVALISEGCDEDKITEPEPPSFNNEASQESGSDKKLTRCKLDDCKLEGLTNVKQPSSAMQIQEPLPTPNLETFPLENIKTVTVDGKLTEVQQEMEYDSVDMKSRWAEVNADLMRIAQMSPEDAAAAAVAAIKEAEAFIAKVEEAAKEAVEAESAAEEARAYAEGLTKELREKKTRPAPKRGKRGRRSQ